MAAAALITHRLRQLAEDWCTNPSTLSGIDTVFGDADVPLTEGIVTRSAGRRTRIRGYCASLDPASRQDFRRFLTVVATVMERIEEPWGPASPDTPDPLAGFRQELAKPGYAVTDGNILATSVTARLDDAKAHAQTFDLAHPGEPVRRIEGAIDTDPARAIGPAEELVETTAKTILDGSAIAYGKSADLPKLARPTFAALRQLPDDIPGAAKGAEIIRRTLSNLASVVQGLAEIRGLYGTGHGRSGKVRGVGARHARLAVGAAATLATYLLDTQQETPLPSPRRAP